MSLKGDPKKPGQAKEFTESEKTGHSYKASRMLLHGGSSVKEAVYVFICIFCVQILLWIEYTSSIFVRSSSICVMVQTLLFSRCRCAKHAAWKIQYVYTEVNVCACEHANSVLKHNGNFISTKYCLTHFRYCRSILLMINLMIDFVQWLN